MGDSISKKIRMLSCVEQKVLGKVTKTLEENHIPYQITGGLAAVAYGGTRPLYDIDIDVYAKDMLKIKELFQTYLVKDLFHCEDSWWNGYLMIFKIDSVLIDISQVEEWYAVNPQGAKLLMNSIPEDAEIGEIAGIRLPIVQKKTLVEYKKHMARPTDLEDVRQIEEKL